MKFFFETLVIAMLFQPVVFAANLALTDAHMDQIIILVGNGMNSLQEAVKTLWVTLSPVLLAYILWRQALNRRVIEAKIDQNTKVSVEAFHVANGHNDKIANLTKVITDKAIVQEVHVVNSLEDPVKTDQI